MMVVPNNQAQMKAIESVNVISQDYQTRISAAQIMAQNALNILLNAGFDPTAAVYIVNEKFRIPPPKDVGVERTEVSGDPVGVHLPPELLDRPTPDDYEED